MDRFTATYVAVTKARVDKINEHRQLHLAHNRRNLLLDQLNANDKLWLHQCDKHGTATALLFDHCPANQRDSGRSQCSMSSVHLGCRISDCNYANTNEHHQGQDVGAAKLQEETDKLQQDRGIKHDDITLAESVGNVDLEVQKIIALRDKILANGSKPQLVREATTTEEPSLIGGVCNSLELDKSIPPVYPSVSTTAISATLSQSQYATRQNLMVYRNCDSLC